MRALTEAAAKATFLLAVGFLALFASVGRSGDVPEPRGLWTGPMHGPTPATLAGARVVDLAALEALMAETPILIDVGPGARRPANFPAGRPWLPTHHSIPGAVWMPGAGAAPLDAAREALLYRRIAELTQGDKARPIVVFCEPDCWGSWNVGKRLVMQGYSGVHWFPAGIDGWRQRHETSRVAPDAGWSTGP